MKKYTKKELRSRMLKYYHRVGRFSPLSIKVYLFMKQVYMYMTRQQQTQEFKNNLYKNYTELIDLTYSFNREDPDKNTIDLVFDTAEIIINNESRSHCTFILLNNRWHIDKMIHLITFLRAVAHSTRYYGYASEDEFFDIMDKLRKLFDTDKIDIDAAVGKYPKRLKKRFSRIK